MRLKSISIRIAFMLLLSLLYIGCEKESFEVTMEFKEAAYEVEVGTSLDLMSQLKIENSDGTPAFTSSDPTVAVVAESGVLTATKPGEATIEATLEGKKAACTVIVPDIKATAITLSPADTTIIQGTSAEIVAVVEPEGYDMENLDWKFLIQPSAAEDVVKTEKLSASEYKITFEDYIVGGSVIVKVTDTNSKIVGEATVKVMQTPKTGVTELSVSPQNLEVLYGAEPVTLDLTYAPEDFDGTFVWTSSNEQVATVKDGTVTFRSEGTAVITVSEEISGLKAQCTVSVGAGVQELMISPDQLDIAIGTEPVTLSVSCKPDNYDKSILEWSSYDEKIAAVDQNGTVTFVSVGTTEIYVTDPISEITATCKVNVNEVNNDEAIKSITLDQTIVNIRAGAEPFQLKAICKDENGKVVENYSNLKWSATKDYGRDGEFDVVEITQQGIVTPLAKGTTIVTVCDNKNQAVKATCTINVSRAEIKVEKVELDPSEKKIDIGGTFEIKATVTPSDADDKKLDWASDNEDVATVDNTGKVTAVGCGEAVITAASQNGIKGYCKVTVPKYDVERVELSISSLDNFPVGATETITVTVTPSNATDQSVTWTSSDEEIVSVDKDGKVTALKVGEATVTATVDGESATCSVVVVNVVKSISLDQSSKTLKVGDKFVLKENITLNNPDYSTVPTVSWTTSAPDLVSVDQSGNVEALALGKAVITVTSGGLSATCDVTVTDADYFVESIEISGDAEVVKDNTVQLVAKLKPEGLEDVVVDWKSSDSGVATVDKDGKVTGLSVGEVTITASCGSTSAEHKMTVLPLKITSVTLPEALEIDRSKSLTADLAYVVAPENADIKNVVWSVGDESVLTISKEGKITTLKPGKTTVTVTIDEVKSNDCEVTVIAIKPESITLSSRELEIVKEESSVLTYTFTPTEHDLKDVLWSSSDPSVATVDQNGKVTGVELGETVVTVKCRDDESIAAECLVKVKRIDFTISFSAEGNPVLTKGLPQFETVILNPSYVPVDSKYGDSYEPIETSWASSDETLATVDNLGTVVAVYEGDDISDEGSKVVTITHVADGVTKNIELKITRAHPKSIDITSQPEDKKMYVGDSFTFTSQVNPSQANQRVLWSYQFHGTSSGNGNPADIGPYTGEFKPAMEGEFTIKAQCSDPFSTIWNSVTVNVLPVEISSAEINPESLELYPGDETSLSVSIQPHNATYKQITWASSNENVVKVTQATEQNKGDIVAVAPGTATITAKLSNGTRLTCEVTVKEAPVSTVKIGDYYYSDGMTSSELIPDKTPVGVVFSLKNAAANDAKLNAKMGDKITGLVISLKETTHLKWDAAFPTVKVSEWATAKGYATLTGVGYANNDWTVTEQGKYFCGYNNTQAIKAYMVSDEYSENGNQIGLLEGCPDEDMEGTSGWYVPSYGELSELVANQDEIAPKIKAAGGTDITIGGKICYWTSTEGVNADQAVAIRFLGSGKSEDKLNAVKYKDKDSVGNRYRVRYIFAF